MSRWVHVLLLGAILAIGAWFSLRNLTFFSTDTGLRYLQALTFQEYGWRHAAVPYAGHAFDPGMRFVPYYYAFSRYGDQLLLEISPFFPLAVAGLQYLLGRVGIVVAPIAGTMLTAASVVGLWHLAGRHRGPWLFWGTALATPLVFYSLTLWDHTTGVALSTLAVYMAARALDDRRWFWPLAAGLLVALAVAQRADIAAMAVALGLALLVVGWPHWQQILHFGLGGLLGLAISAPFNLMWVGHPLGIVIAGPYLGYLDATYYSVDAYQGIDIPHASVATMQLLAVVGGQPLTLVAALLLVTGSIFLALVLRAPSGRRPLLLYICLGLIVSGTALGVRPAEDGRLTGLFTTLPLFGLALAYVDKPQPGIRVYRLVFLTTWLYVMLTLLVLRAPGGTQWGSRYLLAAVPLLFFLALYTAAAYRRGMRPDEARALTRVVAILLAVSLAVQLVGVRALFVHKAEQRRLQAAVAVLPADVVLTSSPTLASFMTALEDKVFLYVESEADIALLAERMAGQGVQRFAWVPSTAPLEVPNRAGDILIEAETPFVYRLEPLPDP